MVGVELRPPRTGMSSRDSIDVWIDMYHAMERLARRDTVIFLTDNAVGQAEEENLGHLSANLSDQVDRSKIVPFLTAKAAGSMANVSVRVNQLSGERLLNRALAVAGSRAGAVSNSLLRSCSQVRWYTEGSVSAQRLGSNCYGVS